MNPAPCITPSNSVRLRCTCSGKPGWKCSDAIDISSKPVPISRSWPLRVDKCQVDRRSAAMVRAALQVCDVGRVREEVPQHLLRLRRTVGVEYFQRHADVGRQLDCFLQRGFGGCQQQAVGRLVDRLARQVAIGRVDQVDVRRGGFQDVILSRR